MNNNSLPKMAIDLDITHLQLPKYCDIAKIKNDSERYIAYMKKTNKEVTVLGIAKKYEALWNKAISSKDELKKQFGDQKINFKLLGISVIFV